MEMDKTMHGSRELEFAIFCIENVASKLNVDATKVYAALNISFRNMRFCTRKARSIS